MCSTAYKKKGAPDQGGSGPTTNAYIYGMWTKVCRPLEIENIHKGSDHLGMHHCRPHPFLPRHWHRLQFKHVTQPRGMSP
jgi:hypothetical protein